MRCQRILGVPLLCIIFVILPPSIYLQCALNAKLNYVSLSLLGGLNVYKTPPCKKSCIFFYANPLSPSPVLETRDHTFACEGLKQHFLKRFTMGLNPLRPYFRFFKKANKKKSCNFWKQFLHFVLIICLPL